MSVDTIGQALDAGWSATVRCAWGDERASGASGHALSGTTLICSRWSGRGAETCR